MKKTFLSLTALCATALSASAQSTLFDLNSSGQLTLENRAGGGVSSEQATGGLNNSGYIAGADFSTAQFSAIVQDGYTADLSGDLTLTQSVYFKVAATESAFPTNNQDAVILGLSDSATQVPSSENLIQSGLTNNYIATSIQVGNTNNGGNVDLRFHGFTTGDGGIFGPAGGTTLTVAADAWYFFEVDYAYRNASNDWLFTYTLNESTDAGIVGTELFNLTLNGAIRGNDFGANPELYGFLAGDAPLASRIQGYDNATLVGVPEPSAYALIAGSLALSWIMLRRRA